MTSTLGPQATLSLMHSHVGFLDPTIRSVYELIGTPMMGGWWKWENPAFEVRVPAASWGTSSQRPLLCQPQACWVGPSFRGAVTDITMGPCTAINRHWNNKGNSMETLLYLLCRIRWTPPVTTWWGQLLYGSTGGEAPHCCVSYTTKADICFSSLVRHGPNWCP